MTLAVDIPHEVVETIVQRVLELTREERREPSDGWLDAAGAAEYLGMPKTALHKLTAAREVPFEQDGPGCKLYFKRSDLDTWRRQEAVAEVDMSNATPRRTRVERGIYRRTDERFEIGWRDAQGKLRWRVVDGGIMAARAALAQEHSKRARGEAVAADPRLTFDAAADAWWEARAGRLRPMTQSAYRAGLKHLRRHFGRQRLATITAGDVAAYVTSKDSLKGWTIKGHLTVVSAIFRYANRHLGVTTPNP